MRAFRKLLIVSHRYIGIPLSFLFVLWFASAFVMIYAGGMPGISDAMRVDGASPLDFSRVSLTPRDAVEIAGYIPGTLRLRTVLDRPAYEFTDPGYPSTFVYADNGEVPDMLSQDQARRLASDFLDIPQSSLKYDGTLTRVDQWTLTYGAELPLYKFSADDTLGTQAYVSANDAAVSVFTTRHSRLLAWLGTIPHWLYFASLKQNQPLWYETVVWSSGIGCFLALLGLCLGVTQFRKTRPFRLSRAIPYQGLMRWHYLLGVIFGVFALTWVFSGLLSMEPFAWTNARGLRVDPDVYSEGEMDPAAFGAVGNRDWGSLVNGQIKEVEFSWIQGQPYFLANYSGPEALQSVKRERLHQPYQVAGQAEADSILINARDFTVKQGFDIDTLVARLDAATDADVVDYQLLTDYDDYYYSRNNQYPLPVLRIRFDDPMQSWFYVAQSRILTMVHKWSRLERWLYNGLHSLDFAFWYHRRPLWDIGVIVLLLGGLATSCIGLYTGLRRLRTDILLVSAKLSKRGRLIGVKPADLGTFD